MSDTPQYGAEAEPHLVADPADPRRLVAAWQQDRYANGGSLALGVSTSVDGGQTWERRSVPGITGCPPRGRDRTSDPWLAFGPDGRVYLASVPGHFDPVFVVGPDTNVVVDHSSDGGITWSAPVVVTPRSCADCPEFNDRPTITADPVVAGRAYVVWTRFAATWLSRTEDGGATWSRPSRIYEPRSPTKVTPFASTISTLPDHTLLDTFARSSAGFPILALRSTTAGTRWSRPVRVGRALSGRGPTDPDTGREIRVGLTPVVAVARGAVYTAWTQPLGRLRSRIVLTKSTDGGRSWRTPRAVSGRRTQAFLPALSAAPDGTLALTYYDFRRDRRGDRALTTDVWLRQSRDGGATWDERHLAGPFDLRTAPVAGLPTGGPRRARFLADYTGLVAVPGGFGAALALARPLAREGRSDIFFATSPARQR